VVARSSRDGHVILEGCHRPEGVGVDPTGGLLGVWTASPMGQLGVIRTGPEAEQVGEVLRGSVR